LLYRLVERMLLHKEKLLSAFALFVSLCISSVTGSIGNRLEYELFILSLCFIAITRSLWMCSHCGSGVEAKRLLLLSWLKEREMGMDVCS